MECIKCSIGLRATVSTAARRYACLIYFFIYKNNVRHRNQVTSTTADKGYAWPIMLYVDTVLQLVMTQMEEIANFHETINIFISTKHAIT